MGATNAVGLYIFSAIALMVIVLVFSQIGVTVVSGAAQNKCFISVPKNNQVLNYTITSSCAVSLTGNGDRINLLISNRSSTVTMSITGNNDVARTCYGSLALTVTGNGDVIYVYGTAVISNTMSGGNNHLLQSSSCFQGSSTTTVATTSTSTTATTSTLIPACTSNWAGGPCLGSIAYTQNTTLSGNVNASQNATINSGVTLVTGGFGIWIGGTLTNKGAISTGRGALGQGGVAPAIPLSGGVNGTDGGAVPASYGGSGGGGSGALGCCYGHGGNGGSTLAAGGLGAYNGAYWWTPGPGGANGTTPAPPTLSGALIQSWYSGGWLKYLSGAGGGSGSSAQSQYSTGQGDNGGNGGNGVYIQAANLQLSGGVIDASGDNSYCNINTDITGGGGGGGVIALAYSGAYSPGTYLLNGGAATNAPGISCNPPSGQQGGAGQVLTYQYTTPPIAVS